MLPSQRLERYGWTVGVEKDCSGRRCMLGALVPDPDQSGDSYAEAVEAYGPDALEALVSACAEVIGRESADDPHPPSLNNTAPDEIIWLANDVYLTGAAQAVALLKSVGL